MMLEDIRLSPAEVSSLLTARSNSLNAMFNMLKAYQVMTPEQKDASKYGAFSFDSPSWRHAYGVTTPGSVEEIAESYLTLSKTFVEATLQSLRQQQVEIK